MPKIRCNKEDQLYIELVYDDNAAQINKEVTLSVVDYNGNRWLDVMKFRSNGFIDLLPIKPEDVKVLNRAGLRIDVFGDTNRVPIVGYQQRVFSMKPKSKPKPKKAKAKKEE